MRATPAVAAAAATTSVRFLPGLFYDDCAAAYLPRGGFCWPHERQVEAASLAPTWPARLGLVAAGRAF